MDQLDLAHRRWVDSGSPVTAIGVPPGIKHWLIRDHARRSDLRILVETGSYRGDTIGAMLPFFDEIYSVDLAPHLYEHCRERFAAEPKAHLFLDESPHFLSSFVAQHDEPALFYLDAHWSNYGDSSVMPGDTARGEKACPVMDELVALTEIRSPSVIIIDDVRMFGVTSNWPEVGSVIDFVAEELPEYTADVFADQIIVLPR